MDVQLGGIAFAYTSCRIGTLPEHVKVSRDLFQSECLQQGRSAILLLKHNAWVLWEELTHSSRLMYAISPDSNGTCC